MHWTERLNSLGGSLNIGGLFLDVLHWAHNDHLRDNVPHRHTYFEVCLVGAHGRGHFRLQDRVHKIARDDLFIARPGEVHQIQNTTQPLMELFWVGFGRKTGESKKEERAGLSGLWHAFAASTCVVAHDERTDALWRVLRETASAPAVAGQELQLRALMSALLLSIMQTGAGVAAPREYSVLPSCGRTTQTAQLAVRYIHDNLHRALPVAEVAAHIHVSPRHLTRLLTQYTGVAPADYIERARLDRARHLLRTSTLSLKEVARDAGYGDVHHFTRAFTRRCRMPPGDYRKRGAPRLEHLDVPNRQKSGALV
jgi:AraC-like DNA-binding protein/mannose-6-phosphate isomerase-like protein (cupin superfamily)